MSRITPAAGDALEKIRTLAAKLGIPASEALAAIEQADGDADEAARLLSAERGIVPDILKPR